MNTGPHCAQIILHCQTERKCTWKQQKAQFTGPLSFVEHQQVLHAADALIALSRNKYSLSQQPELFYDIQSKGQTCPASSTGTSNNSIKRTVSTELGSSDWPYFPVIITETSQPVTMLQSTTCLHQWACYSSENMSSSQFFMLISCNSHI